MAVYADRVQETTTTTGTGTYSLAGAATGYRTFITAVGSGALVTYAAEDGTNWEVGEGTVTTGSPATLTRTTIIASSNSGSAVNWSAGEKKIFLTLPASRMVTTDQNQSIDGNKTFTGAQMVLPNSAQRIEMRAGFSALQGLAISASNSSGTSVVGLHNRSPSGAGSLDFDSSPVDGSSVAQSRFFRNSITTGNSDILIYQPGTATIQHRFRSGADATLISSNGSGQLVLGNLSNAVRTLAPSHRFEDGSAYAPAIAFANDTDTGVFRTGTNQLAITTGGASRFVVSDTEVSSAVILNSQRGFASAEYSAGSGAPGTINWTNGQNQARSLTASGSLVLSNPVNGATYKLRIVQGGTGSYTITWPTIKWAGGSAPTLSTAVGAEDVITLYYNGASYYGQAATGFA